MTKRILGILIALCMLLPATALALNIAKEGLPIVDEPITLTAANSQSSIQIDFNEVQILKDFAEASGVTMEFRNIPSSDASTQLNLMLAAPDTLPDVLFKLGISAANQAKYAEEGIILPLSDYAEYTPNLNKWFERFPSAKEAMTQADGKIYGAPYILAGESIRMGQKYFFNTDVMEKLGYDKIPTTTDGLLEFLRAAKKLDYNENGEEDEIPLSSFGINSIQQVLYGSFGLANRGGAHTNVFVNEEGKLAYAWSSENYRDMLRFLNTLYEEKLLDQDIFTMDLAQLIAKVSTGRALTFAMINNGAAAGSPYEKYSLGITEPFEGPKGHKHWGLYQLPASSTAYFTITYQCKHPEAAARWVDHWYSDEGIISYFMGIEGVTYEKDENSPGGLKLTDYVLNNPEGINFEQVLAKYVPWAGGANPSVATNEYFKGGETWPASVAAAEGLINYVPEILWTPFSRYYSAEESREMSEILTELNTYHAEWRAYFITGQKSLDNDWDEYIKGFEGMRLARYIELYEIGRAGAGAE